MMIKETAHECEKSIRDYVNKELSARMTRDYDRKIEDQRTLLNNELDMFQDQIVRRVDNRLGNHLHEIESAIVEI